MTEEARRPASRPNVRRRGGDDAKLLRELVELHERQFRVADVGENVRASFADLMNWWHTNEPLVRAITQQALANQVTQERDRGLMQWRNLRWGVVVAIVSAVIGGIPALIVQILQARGR